jgi:hypothetical protein
MSVIKLFALVNDVKTLIAELNDYSNKAISAGLFGEDGSSQFIPNKELLNGNTLVYAHNNDMAKAHLLDVSKSISGYQLPFGFTSYRNEVDNTLDTPITNRRGEYAEKLKLILPHSSDEVIESLNRDADAIKTSIHKLNERVLGLKPILPKAEVPSFTLYFKDGQTAKIKKAVENAKTVLEDDESEEETESKND